MERKDRIFVGKGSNWQQKVADVTVNSQCLSLGDLGE